MTGRQYAYSVVATTSGDAVSFGFHARSVACYASSSAGGNVWVRLDSTGADAASSGDGISHEIIAGKSYSVTVQSGWMSGASFMRTTGSTSSEIRITAFR